MKLTNKILLAFLVFLFSAVLLNKIIIKSMVKMEFQPYLEEYESQKNYKGATPYAIHKLKPCSIISIRGRYDITIFKSDSAYMKIFWTNEFFRKFKYFSQNSSSLSILPINNYSGARISNISLYWNNLSILNVDKEAIVTLVGFTQNEININAADSAIVLTRNCSFDSVKVTGKNNSLFFIGKPGKAIVNMINGSNIALNMDNGTACGLIDKSSNYAISGSNNKNYLVKQK